MKRIGVWGLVVGLCAALAGCSFGPKEPPLTNWGPALSPDATTIAFANPGEKSFEIYTQILATGERRRLTANEVDDWAPSWSPQGNQLVFVSTREKNVDLYAMALDTLAVTRLTSDPGDDVNPTWGSDGKILFNSNRSGTWEIYRIDPTGENLTKVTDEIQ
jgi:Tol biopolymer transport system component